LFDSIRQSCFGIEFAPIRAIRSEEIRETLQEPLSSILESIRLTLERCPPELAADLVDRGLSEAGYQIKLTREEFAPGGPFAPLNLWLDTNAPRFGFFRPFQGVRSGVQPEPWHFSFAPIAERARRRLSAQVLRNAIEAAPLLGKDEVLESLDELHARYVAAIDLP